MRGVVSDRYAGEVSAIIRVCGLLYEKGMLAGADGNVSVKVSDDFCLTTVSGVHKGMMGPGDLVLVDVDGRVVGGSGPPSSELAMHLAVYREDPGAGAIVHTHAPWTMALSLSGRGYNAALLAESRMLLGEVVEVPYAEPGSPELAGAVAASLGRGPALILERHGSVTIGPTLQDAFSLMECLEHNARIIALSHMLE
jgi:L-fuculose-phosphate aldolase